MNSYSSFFFCLFKAVQNSTFLCLEPSNSFLSQCEIFWSERAFQYSHLVLYLSSTRSSCSSYVDFRAISWTFQALFCFWVWTLVPLPLTSLPPPPPPYKSLKFLLGLTKLGSRKGESKNNNIKLIIINSRLSQKTTLLVFWKMRSFVYLFIYTILVTSRLKKRIRICVCYFRKLCAKQKAGGMKEEILGDK